MLVRGGFLSCLFLFLSLCFWILFFLFGKKYYKDIGLIVLIVLIVCWLSLGDVGICKYILLGVIR